MPKFDFRRDDIEAVLDAEIAKYKDGFDWLEVCEDVAAKFKGLPSEVVEMIYDATRVYNPDAVEELDAEIASLVWDDRYSGDDEDEEDEEDDDYYI